MLESYFESQRIIEGSVVHLSYLSSSSCSLSRSFLFPFVSVVSDIETIPLPAKVLLLCVFARVDQWFHSSRISALTLQHVHDVKSISLILSCVLDSEKVPLSKALGAIIVLHEQVVLELTNFDSFLKIPRLETAFELQSCV